MDPNLEFFNNPDQATPANNFQEEEGQPVSYPNEPPLDGYVDLQPLGGVVDFNNPWAAPNAASTPLPPEIAMLQQHLQQQQQQQQEFHQQQQNAIQQQELHQQQQNAIHQQQQRRRRRQQQRQQLTQRQPTQPPQLPPLPQQQHQQQRPSDGMQVQQPLPLFEQHLRQGSVQQMIHCFQELSQFPWGPIQSQVNGQVTGQMNGQVNGQMNGQMNGQVNGTSQLCFPSFA